MTLGQKLAIDALRGDLRELNKLLEPCQYDGPSWKAPNKKSSQIDIDEYLAKTIYTGDGDDDRRCQIGLLEMLIDRLHCLMLSLATSEATTFTSLAKAGRRLTLKVAHLQSDKQNQRRNVDQLQQSVNASIKGSALFYSPNYEEDLRREMFPILDNLITSLATINDSQALPSGAADIWTQVKHNFDKTALVKVTTAMKRDMERVGKLLAKLEKQKGTMKKEISDQANTLKMLNASQDGLRATIKRKQTEHERQYNELSERCTTAIANAKHSQSSCRELTQQLTQREAQFDEMKTEETKLARLIEEMSEKIEQERTISRMAAEQHAIDMASVCEREQQLSRQLTRAEKDRQQLQKLKTRLLELSKSESSLSSRSSLLESEVRKARDECANATAQYERLRMSHSREMEAVSGELATVVDKCRSLTCTGCIEITSKDETEQLRRELNQYRDKVAHSERQVTLLAAYPDLAPHRTAYHDELLNATTTGDVSEQMKRQVDANMVRLERIQIENDKLNNALGRLADTSNTITPSGDHHRHLTLASPSTHDDEPVIDDHSLALTDLESEISIPSTMTATIPTYRSSSSSKFQGMGLFDCCRRSGR